MKIDKAVQKFEHEDKMEKSEALQATIRMEITM